MVDVARRAADVANCYTATEQGVEVIPVLNKIDLPRRPGQGDPGNRGRDRHPGAGCDPRERQDRRERRCHPRGGDRPGAAAGRREAPAAALIIDSWFDNYVGVVMLVRVMEGTLRPKAHPAHEHRRLVSPQVVFTPKSKTKKT